MNSGEAMNPNKSINSCGYKNLKEQMNRAAKLTETALQGYVSETDADFGIIYDAMRYSLMAGGKRLRPFLVLEFACLAAEQKNGSLSPKEREEVMTHALPYAAALEMIHTYSLIHDDLPCMDNDDLRRGKPTNHKVYGYANALLAGDALLTRSFGVAVTNPYMTAEQNGEAVALLSACAGASGMIGGQVMDLIGETVSYPLSKLERLQSLKTGELIRCAVLLGCIAGDGTNTALKQAAEKYACGIGRAFQVIDDILDVIGDEVLLGKPIGSDAESHKTTFVTVMSLDGAREYAEKITKSAVEAIADYHGSELLCELAVYLLERKN